MSDECAMQVRGYIISHGHRFCHHDHRASLLYYLVVGIVSASHKRGDAYQTDRVSLKGRGGSVGTAVATPSSNDEAFIPRSIGHGIKPRVD